MMLRRLKEDVEKSLAPKEETIVEVRIFTSICILVCDLLRNAFVNLLKYLLYCHFLTRINQNWLCTCRMIIKWTSCI